MRVLAGATATIGGRGAAADILRRHLAALGATVAEPSGVALAPEIAASATVRLGDGRRREVVVDWAGPVRDAGIVDEATAQAVCGIMHVNGRRSGTPQGLAVDYCGTAAGVLAVTGLLAGLLVEPAGPDVVHTSVAQAALLAVSQYLAAAGAEDAEAVDLAPGGPPFTSADGVRFEVEALQPEIWGAFWTKLGADPAAIRTGWRPFQFRYATATAPLPPALHDAARSATFADIQSAAEVTTASVCRLYGAHEHLAELSDMDGAGVPAPWSIQPTPGGSAPRHAGTPDLPLAGTLILEAGRRIQAPLAAHLLGLLGARIVRIEPPGGDPLRGMPPSCDGLSARWLALNRGKEAIEIDIKDPADRRRLRDLAADADVFLHNWAPGKADELGLSAAGLAPSLVYTYTSGWGGHNLPDTPLGTDFMVQARSGLADTVRPADEPPAPSLMTVLDVLGGLLGAEAVVAGLLARRQHGTGVAVESSLLGAASALHGPPSDHRESRRPAGFRRPRLVAGDWVAAPDQPATGRTVRVTTDLSALPTDPRMTGVIGRDERRCPALPTPWRFA